MLPKQLRLSNERIRLILKKGSSVYSETLQCKFFLDNINNPQYAIIIPKKTIKKSTKRNRIKRLLQNVIFDLSNKHQPPIHGVFIVRSFPKELTIDLFKEEVARCLRSIA